jgi:hypothetical protein
MMRVLSLGAGVQSSTAALMIAKGEIEPVECAVFADTGDEPRAVYEWLAWLQLQLPFPVHTVSAGVLSKDSTRIRLSKRSGNTYLAPALPVHLRNTNGKKGMSQRQCTRNHKIDPINKFLRAYAKVPRGTKTPLLNVLIGISTDEALRMKPAQKPWLKNTWPLIEANMSRQDCLNWMQRNGYPQPPRSACVFCPYKSDAEWRHMKENDPSSFMLAVQYEKTLQASYEKATALPDGVVPFLHASLRPLSEAEFKSKGKPVDQFNNECEGMCGV